MRRPNILYFVCHDLGRAVGCYGADMPTPRIDAFALQGIRFDQAHCASPACSPSRACAMTGMYAHVTGAIGLSHMGWPLDLNWTTTVDDLNAAGYQTILSGINHERHPRTDRYDVDVTRHWHDWRADRAVDNAIAALRSRDRSRPFYLNVATQEPHAVTWKDVGGRMPMIDLDFPWVPQGMPQSPALTAAFARFASSIAFMDQQFGRLLDAIEELRLRDNTVVVFTTDHGIAGPRGKGTLYGLGTEIAMIVRLPDGAHGAPARGQLVSNLDLRATIAGLAGTSTLAPTHGRSLSKVLNDASAPHHDAIFIERNFHGEKPWRTESDYVDLFDPTRAVRTFDHLYLRRFAPEARPADPAAAAQDLRDLPWTEWESALPLAETSRPAEELYNLRVDPHETHNCIDATNEAASLLDLRQRLEGWMRDTHDFLPGKPPSRPEPPGWGDGWPVVETA